MLTPPDSLPDDAMTKPHSRTPRRPGSLSALAGAWLLVACSGEPGAELALSHDLLAELPAADVISEVAHLDFTRDAARRYLVSGFSRREPGRGELLSFLWAEGEESLVELPLVRRRDLTLVIDGRPFVLEDGTRQTVTVHLNGHELESLELRQRRDTYRVALAKEHLVVGRNRLRFTYGYARAPSEVRKGSTDDRRLAMAWYSLGVEPGPETDPGEPRADGEVLFLPYGTAVDYYLALGPRAELRVDGWQRRGGGELVVAVREDGRDEEVRAVFREGSEPTTVTLDDTGEPRIVRLSLRAAAEGATSDGDGVVLRRPAIYSLADESEPAAAHAAETPAVERRPDVFLYTIDTLRADRLGCYGYERPISPAIDAFAAEAILFENAVAQSSWTKASIASVFTGLWPVDHGAMKRPQKLADEALTLPEILRDAGYQTVAFVANPNVSDRFGFDQGFEEFNYFTRKDDTPSDELTAAILDWLDARQDPRPLFLYMHHVDPHDPYSPPPEFRRRHAAGVPPRVVRDVRRIFKDLASGRKKPGPEIIGHLEALYDADIASNDHAFGEFVRYLKEGELFDDALILFQSDHGEEFYEHEHFRHGRSLHVESLRVPLVLKLPGSREGRRVAEPVQHVDVLPTLLVYLGLPVPANLEGRDLLAAGGVEPRPIYSYVHLDGPARVSVLDAGYKLIQRLDGDSLSRPQLYDVEADPEEQRNLAAELEVRTGYLASLLRCRLKSGRGLVGEEAVLDEETLRDLQALGYLR